MKNIRVSIDQNDITSYEIDAIVNAANSTLLGGGGVDGAIHRKAGIELFNECKKLNGCKVGEAKITKGYNLPAKYVIHTVGPIYSEKENRDDLLYNAYINSLKLADEYNLKSIAFPNISTGVYNYPKERAAKIAFNAINEYTENYETNIEHIIFCCYDDENYDIYAYQLM